MFLMAQAYHGYLTIFPAYLSVLARMMAPLPQRRRI